MRWALLRGKVSLIACAEETLWPWVSAGVRQILQSCEVNSAVWESLRPIQSLHG